MGKAENPIDEFCYQELDPERECIFMISHGYKKPDDKHLLRCPAYLEGIRRKDRSFKIAILRCDDCEQEGRTCGNKITERRR